MEWIPLESEVGLAQVIEQSFKKPLVIFKHSTRCSISSMALNRIDSAKAVDGIDFYYLDLIKFRNVSNKIATDFNVIHESPQVLLIKDGKCVFHASHGDIRLSILQSLNLFHV